MGDNVFTVTLEQIIDSEPENFSEGTTDSDEDKIHYKYLVMPYKQVSLRKMMQSTHKIGFDSEHVITLLYNLLCSLNYIHTAGLIHRDIKPDNILMDDKCRVFICDFGISCADASLESATSFKPSPDLIISMNSKDFTFRDLNKMKSKSPKNRCHESISKRLSRKEAFESKIKRVV